MKKVGRSTSTSRPPDSAQKSKKKKKEVRPFLSTSNVKESASSKNRAQPQELDFATSGGGGAGIFFLPGGSGGPSSPSSRGLSLQETKPLKQVLHQDAAQTNLVRQTLLNLQRKIDAGNIKGVQLELLDLNLCRCIVLCRPEPRESSARFDPTRIFMGKDQEDLGVRVIITYSFKAKDAHKVALPHYALVPRSVQRSAKFQALMESLRENVANMSTRWTRNQIEDVIRYVVAQLTSMDGQDTKAHSTALPQKEHGPQKSNSTIFSMDLSEYREQANVAAQSLRKNLSKSTSFGVFSSEKHLLPSSRKSSSSSLAGGNTPVSSVSSSLGRNPQPCPRFCGATFSGPGLLVYYNSGLQEHLRSFQNQDPLDTVSSPSRAKSPGSGPQDPTVSRIKGAIQTKFLSGTSQPPPSQQQSSQLQTQHHQSHQSHQNKTEPQQQTEQDQHEKQQSFIHHPQHRHLHQQDNVSEFTNSSEDRYIPRTFTELLTLLNASNDPQFGIRRSSSFESNPGTVSPNQPWPAYSPFPRYFGNEVKGPNIPEEDGDSGLSEELTAEDLLDWNLRLAHQGSPKPGGSGLHTVEEEDEDDRRSKSSFVESSSFTVNSRVAILGTSLLSPVHRFLGRALRIGPLEMGNPMLMEIFSRLELVPKGEHHQAVQSDSDSDSSMGSPRSRSSTDPDISPPERHRLRKLGSFDRRTRIVPLTKQKHQHRALLGPHQAFGKQIDRSKVIDRQEDANSDDAEQHPVHFSPEKQGAYSPDWNGRGYWSRRGSLYGMVNSEAVDGGYPSDHAMTGVHDFVSPLLRKTPQLINRLESDDFETHIDQLVSDEDDEYYDDDPYDEIGSGVYNHRGSTDDDDSDGREGYRREENEDEGDEEQEDDDEEDDEDFEPDTFESLLCWYDDFSDEPVHNWDKLPTAIANMYACRTVGRFDLVHSWQALSVVNNVRVAMYESALQSEYGWKGNYANSLATSWALHPCGRGFIQGMFEEYSKIRDVQTLAIVSCILQDEARQAKWSGATPLLDPRWKKWCDKYCRAYASILHQWGLNAKRAEVMKYVTRRPEEVEQDKLTFVPLCPHCKEPCTDISCQKEACKARGTLLRCVVCEVAVRGLCTFCPACGHGGHAAHMDEWFRFSQECPTGCGCLCGQEI